VGHGAAGNTGHDCCTKKQFAGAAAGLLIDFHDTPSLWLTELEAHAMIAKLTAHGDYYAAAWLLDILRDILPRNLKEVIQ
jgi:hypothetical protein